MRVITTSYLLAGMLALWSASAWAISRTADFTPNVDAYLEPLVQTNNFSGVVFVARGKSVVFAKGYGFASVEHQVPNTAGTRFQIASLSKPFTSAAVMLLVQRGRIDLHAPLARLIPGYPHGERLTVHHLLSHRSGIPNINDFPEYQRLQTEPQTPASLVAVFRDKPLEFAPGKRYGYSNSNYNLLAYLIEHVSGLSYQEFIERELLRPLNLAQTGHRSSMAEIVPNLAVGYAPMGTVDLGRAQYVDWTAKTGNGSLHSTAGDLARFVRAIHRTDLLKETFRSALFEHHSASAGYGWFVAEANGKAVHHVNGRSPGWAAQLDYYPEEDVTIVVLSNVYASVPTAIARAVGALHFGGTPQPMPALRAEPLSDADAARLAGTYRFGADYYIPNSTVMIVANNGRIQAEYPGGYPASPYVPITSTEFIVRPFWMSAKFEIGPEGIATSLVLDGFRGMREQ